MADKKKISGFVTIVVCVVVGAGLICYGLSNQERRSDLDFILTVIGIIIAIAPFIYKSFLKINSKKHNENKNQEGDSPEDDVNRGNEKCWSHNWKCLMVVAVFSVLVIVGLAVYQNNKEKKIEWDARLKEDSIAAIKRHLQDSLRQDSIQRRFNDLDKKFDNRMKQELTFENAYELIRGDSCVLYEILGMINDNPEIETEHEEYIERFRNRATDAKKKVSDAIVDYPGVDSEKMFEEYGPKINQIEQMLNSL